MIELFLPSILGWERVAMDVAAGVASRMGFPPARIDDIKTAVSEATLNAFEHGNALDASRHVRIVVIPAGEKLEIRVRNRTGRELPPRVDVEAVPDLQQKLGGYGAARGWGVFLIKSLADEVEFKTTSAHTGFHATASIGSFRSGRSASTMETVNTRPSGRHGRTALTRSHRSARSRVKARSLKGRRVTCTAVGVCTIRPGKRKTGARRAQVACR